MTHDEILLRYITVDQVSPTLSSYVTNITANIFVKLKCLISGMFHPVCPDFFNEIKSKFVEYLQNKEDLPKHVVILSIIRIYIKMLSYFRNKNLRKYLQYSIFVTMQAQLFIMYNKL